MDLPSLEKIIEFIKADLDGCLKGGVNISLALILSAYTEFFGHLLTGNDKNGESYEEWLKYMGDPYKAILDSGVNLYKIIRCGLVHEYTIKKSACIGTEKDFQGIEVKDDVIYFNNQQYTQDFIKSIEKYYKDIQTNTSLQRNFEDFRNGKPIVI